jgi:hypothetical protein
MVLTYMATLEHLCAAGKLRRHVPDLEDLELPERVMYFAPEFEAWASSTLKAALRDRGRDLTPYEQAELICYEFIIGRPMAYSVDYRKLDPHGAQVWELKTEDVRIFGWFARKAHFVAVGGALKKDLRKAKDYTPHIQKVAKFRNILDLNEPKAITGVTRDAVL